MQEQNLDHMTWCRYCCQATSFVLKPRHLPPADKITLTMSAVPPTPLSKPGLGAAFSKFRK